MHPGQVTFKPSAGRARCLDSQQPAIHPRLELKTNRAHITQDLTRRFLKRKVKAAFAALRRSIGEMSGKTGFACSCCSRNENAAIAEKAFATHHPIQAGDAAGYPIKRCLVRESYGRNRHD